MKNNFAILRVDFLQKCNPILLEQDESLKKIHDNELLYSMVVSGTAFA
jgi:hypothetical protein